MPDINAILEELDRLQELAAVAVEDSRPGAVKRWSKQAGRAIMQTMDYRDSLQNHYPALRDEIKWLQAEIEFQIDAQDKFCEDNQRLQAQVAELRAALEPFAKYGATLDPSIESHCNPCFLRSRFVAAHKALAASEKPSSAEAGG